MRNPLIMTIALCTLTMAASCGADNAEKQAQEMLTAAEEMVENGDYQKALDAIDTLRANFPKAIETRKRALTVYQDAALRQAQANLAVTDSLLEAAKREYEEKKVVVEDAKARLCATAEQLTDLTMTRLRRDSLQVVFDTECAKIKYIHKKQKE